MKNTLVIIIFSVLIGLVSFGQDRPGPPAIWEQAFRDEKDEVWKRLTHQNGKVSARSVIEECFGRGSHHDGERQLATAFALLQLQDDPIPVLGEMMQSSTAEKRAFAVLVSGLIGDTRLTDPIASMVKDHSPLGAFPGDWFWDRVSDVALESLREMNRGGLVAHLLKVGESPADWHRGLKR